MFYEDNFGGETVLDMDLAGARNVFMKVGTGRIHFYDQPPIFSGRGSIHHFGIQTDDMESVITTLKSDGVVFIRTSWTPDAGSTSWFRRRMMFLLNCLKWIRNSFRLSCEATLNKITLLSNAGDGMLIYTPFSLLALSTPL
jgi:hypothetical protein